MRNKRIVENFRRPLHLTLVLMGGFSVTAFAQGTGQPPETEQTAESDATNDSNVVVERNRGQPTPDPGGQCGSCG